MANGKFKVGEQACYDEPLFGKALSAVLKDVQTMTGKKSIYVTHSQGGRVGWATDTDNMAAIIAVEPGFAPEVGSDTYKKFVAAKVPMLFLFGDYIENGPENIHGNSHFMFHEKNNAEIADLIGEWLEKHNL